MGRLNDFMARLELSPLSNYCREHGRIANYAKGERMVCEGEICRHIGFVRSGYFKYTSLDSKGEECVTGFSFEGEVVTDYIQSFLFNQPALTSIVAGCDAEVIQVAINQVRSYIIKSNPEFIAENSTHLLQEAYCRYLALHTLTPAERYSMLQTRCGHVIDTVPYRELASYLCISRRQFQRIRENRDVL